MACGLTYQALQYIFLMGFHSGPTEFAIKKFKPEKEMGAVFTHSLMSQSAFREIVVGILFSLKLLTYLRIIRFARKFAMKMS